MRFKLKKKILAILPESIGGRLTMTSLFNGFEQCGYDCEIIDMLKDNEEKNKEINAEKYDFLVSYDFVGIKFKTDYNLDIKTINYFSDVIESDCSGTYWKDYYDKLQDESNFVFYWDNVLTKKAIKEKKFLNISYLPHSVDIDVYQNTHLPPKYDVMFAGRLTYGIRCERFLKIIKALPDVKFALFCFEKHLNQVCEQISQEDASLLKSIYKGFIDTEEKISVAINKTKIVINFTSQGESSLNYRIFQALACEKLLLTDFKSELRSLFTIGEDVIYYNNDEELIEQIKDYLKDPEKYENIIKNGRKTVELKYASNIMVEKIFQTIDNK